MSVGSDKEAIAALCACVSFVDDNLGNVSLGLVYDAKRKLFRAVDTNSRVFALRLDLKTADVQPLR